MRTILQATFENCEEVSRLQLVKDIASAKTEYGAFEKALYEKDCYKDGAAIISLANYTRLTFWMALDIEITNHIIES